MVVFDAKRNASKLKPEDDPDTPSETKLTRNDQLENADAQTTYWSMY
jgi:hypothetical protein